MARPWCGATRGLYFARTPMLLWAAPMNNFRIPAGDLSVRLPFSAGWESEQHHTKQMALIGINLNSYPLDNLPILTSDQITQIAGALGLVVNPYFGVQPLVVDQDYKNPRATQVGAGVEREITSGITVGADFTYVKTDYLQRNRELNLGVPEPRATDPAQRPIFPTARPDTLLGSVQLREVERRVRVHGAHAEQSRPQAVGRR